MKKEKNNRANIPIKLILILIALVLGILLTELFHLKNNEKNFRTSAENQLTSIADLKEGEIIQWRKERFADARVLFSNDMFNSLVQHFVQRPGDNITKIQLLEWIENTRSNYDYNGILLLNNKGDEMLQTPDTLSILSETVRIMVKENALNGEVFLSDFYWNENDNRIYLALIVPIYNRTGMNKRIGTLIMRIDPTHFLYPLITTWPVPSRTAETLLIRRDGENALFLNPLKFNQDPVLSVKAPLSDLRIPAVKVILGQRGIVEGLDYRNVPVIADVRAIPDSPWYIVARIDKGEVNGPLIQARWLSAFLIASLLLGGGAGIGFIWRQQRFRFYKERASDADKIRKLNRLYTIIGEINQAIVRIREPLKLMEKTCQIAVEQGGFLMAWIGISDDQTKHIKPIAFAGKTEGYLEKLNLTLSDKERGIGPTATALKSGSHYIVNDIIIDDRMGPWRAHALKIGFRSSAAFPLIVKNKTYGVFNLYAGSPGFFDDDEVKLLNELAMDLSFALEASEVESNRKATEEELRQSLEKYRDLFQNAEIALFNLSLDGSSILRLNRKFCEMSGYSENEMLNNRKIVRPVHPEAEARLLELFGRDGSVVDYELDVFLKNKDIRSFSISMHVNKKLGIVEGSAVDITERKNNHAMLQKYADQLSVVNQIVRVISGSNDIKDIYNVFVDQMRRLMDFDRTSIVRFDDSGENWTVVMGWNRNKPFIPQGIPHPIRGSIVELIRDKGKPLLENKIGDLGEWPENSLLLKEGIQSRLLVPLKIEGTVRGFLTLASGIPGQFKEQDPEIVQMIADHLAIAQQKSELFDQVINHTDELESRVHQRTAALESAIKEMEEFTYSISHDLRAPLRHISGYGNLLTENYHASLPEKAQYYLGAISTSIKSMGRLIDDLLQFSKSGRVKMQESEIDLNNMISEVIGQLSFENTTRIIEWIVNPLPIVKGDPSMLKLVWENLLSNAVKFTGGREEARIEVFTDTHYKEFVFGIHDNGIGFEMKYAGKLFGVFQRLHPAEQFEGTGIGLANVKRIILRHGGRVWAESIIDVGSTFYFTIPK